MNKVKISEVVLNNDLEMLSSSVNNAIELGSDCYELNPYTKHDSILEFFKQSPGEAKGEPEFSDEDFHKTITQNLLAQNEFYNQILSEIQIIKEEIKILGE